MPPRTIVRTVVLARDLQQFHAWCRETRHRPRDRSLVYAAGPHSLRGLTGPVRIVRYGAWWDRVDGAALEAAAARLEYEARRLEAACA